jgi:hypothetical protein
MAKKPKSSLNLDQLLKMIKLVLEVAKIIKDWFF